ncbi:hypothetical protein BDK51DRAFT_40043 [Blyttiomyces helicus]|uniref:Myb-like domain-containing protein n=1 Tax=Blyttiomyces helicus TaxID=388810 RepID=A0A4P9W6H9_9FUNG|nr:hypothetical protein BDK51DRAFT_40043 [Blyttiomyces helicus]|eukprot:RKO87924.1 hypothetical protein BDK51DRAFT_40043 [Blyttiomyces helicus]
MEATASTPAPPNAWTTSGPWPPATFYEQSPNFVVTHHPAPLPPPRQQQPDPSRQATVQQQQQQQQKQQQQQFAAYSQQQQQPNGSTPQRLPVAVSKPGSGASPGHPASISGDAPGTPGAGGGLQTPNSGGGGIVVPTRTGSMDDGVPGSEVKRKKFRWTAARDIILLTAIKIQKPYRAGYGHVKTSWDNIAKEFNSNPSVQMEDQEYNPLSGPLAQARFSYLGERHRAGDLSSLRKYGTEAEFKERVDLITHISQEVIKQAGSRSTERRKKSRKSLTGGILTGDEDGECEDDDEEDEEGERIHKRRIGSRSPESEIPLGMPTHSRPSMILAPSPLPTPHFIGTSSLSYPGALATSPHSPHLTPHEKELELLRAELAFKKAQWEEEVKWRREETRLNWERLEVEKGRVAMADRREALLFENIQRMVEVVKELAGRSAPVAGPGGVRPQ